MNFNDLPKYAPTNDSITGSHDVLNPGPEMSKFDVQRHEAMKLKYGKRILSTRSQPQRICSKCGAGIHTSDSVVVNGLPFHGACFVNESR
jgi:hypothetical protein